MDVAQNCAHGGGDRWRRKCAARGSLHPSPPPQREKTAELARFSIPPDASTSVEN